MRAWFHLQLSRTVGDRRLFCLFEWVFVSSDVNECLTGNHNCVFGQICINTEGSFRCQRETGCGTGYELTDNNKCKGNMIRTLYGSYSFCLWKSKIYSHYSKKINVWSFFCNFSHSCLLKILTNALWEPITVDQSFCAPTQQAHSAANQRISALKDTYRTPLAAVLVSLVSHWSKNVAQANTRLTQWILYVFFFFFAHIRYKRVRGQYLSMPSR